MLHPSSKPAFILNSYCRAVMGKRALSLSLSLMIWLNTFGEPKGLEKEPSNHNIIGGQ